MNVKTIVTIALIGLLGVGTAAGIFLSDRSQQQEQPLAAVQQVHDGTGADDSGKH